MKEPLQVFFFFLAFGAKYYSLPSINQFNYWNWKEEISKRHFTHLIFFLDEQG